MEILILVALGFIWMAVVAVAAGAFDAVPQARGIATADRERAATAGVSDLPTTESVAVGLFSYEEDGKQTFAKAGRPFVLSANILPSDIDASPEVGVAGVQFSLVYDPEAVEFSYAALSLSFRECLMTYHEVPPGRVNFAWACRSNHKVPARTVNIVMSALTSTTAVTTELWVVNPVVSDIESNSLDVVQNHPASKPLVVTIGLLPQVPALSDVGLVLMMGIFMAAVAVQIWPIGRITQRGGENTNRNHLSRRIWR